jgi:hypothetical protein
MFACFAVYFNELEISALCGQGGDFRHPGCVMLCVLLVCTTETTAHVGGALRRQLFATHACSLALLFWTCVCIYAIR